jgi:predicted TIM-barrel enzyme
MIVYQLEIRSVTMIWVEHIKAATALIKTGIQEQIADHLQETLGGHLILTGVHQGVAIESIRLPE